MIRAVRDSILAFTIARTRRFVDIKKDKPRREPTTDIPPPTDHGYVQGTLDKKLHYESFTLLEANKDVSGPKSFNDALKERPL